MRSSIPLVAWLLSAATSAWDVPSNYALYASPDGHSFQLADGTPFFYQVDTAWMLMTRLTYDEAETYFADRAAKGFTVVQACAAPFEGIDEKNRAGDFAFVGSDVNSYNEPYWAHVDSIVELAWKHGIRIAMFPAWGEYVHSSVNEPGVFNTGNAGAYGEFIGKRYPYLPKLLFGDTNPHWMNKTQVRDEYAYGGVPSVYTVTDWLPVYDALAEGLIRGEKATIAGSTLKRRQAACTPRPAYIPLISLHDQNQWLPGAPLALASFEAGDRSWLTFDVAQSGHSDFPPNPPIAWWNARRGYETAEIMYSVGETRPGTKRPALDNEPHYEGRYNNAKFVNPAWNASDVRVGSWQTFFSGTAGVAYGQDMVWQMHNPSLFKTKGGGPELIWSEAIKAPGSGQMQFIKKVILDRGNSTFFNRVPSPEIVQGDAGINDKKGTWIMVYTPTGAAFSIETKSLVNCDVTANWYDPLSGAYTKFEYTQCSGASTVREFKAPSAGDHTDWALILESKK